MKLWASEADRDALNGVSRWGPLLALVRRPFHRSITRGVNDGTVGAAGLKAASEVGDSVSGPAPRWRIPTGLDGRPVQVGVETEDGSQQLDPLIGQQQHAHGD